MKAELYDAVIIGGGPAGLTAALYLARARYRVLVAEKERFGGQITITADVVNYPGIERGSGEEISSAMRHQAQSFGAEFVIADVTGLELTGDIKTVKTSRGEFQSFGVIIASGARPRSVGFKGEEEFKGRGVAYCATCDGEFFTGLDVFVVGGGYSAAEESLFLTKYARQVTVLVRGNDFSCARRTADLVKQNEKIKIHYNTIIEEAAGAEAPGEDTALRYARMKDTSTGETWEYRSEAGKTFGIFVFAGYTPATELIKGILDLDEKGYLVTDQNRKTNIDGVYGAGDVCVKRLRQMVTATADGAIAATELERHIANIQEKTGRIPSQPVTRVSPKEETGEAEASGTEGFFTPEIKAQLEALFAKMENPLVLHAVLDGRPVSEELKSFLSELTSLTSKLSLHLEQGEGESPGTPCVKALNTDGTETGIVFHGVPGGHEFNSFVIGLYNASGPGQNLEAGLTDQIRAINHPVSMKVLVSLSCTMCPELVMAAQRIATMNPLVKADIYDLNHFPALRDEYNVMSVPCLVLEPQGKVSFGKKNVEQLLRLVIPGPMNYTSL
jgi:thioredoxin reductase (NADPH)